MSDITGTSEIADGGSGGTIGGASAESSGVKANRGSGIKRGEPIVIDPGAVGGASSDNGGNSGPAESDPPKRRGRKPGSKNRASTGSTQSQAKVDINGLEMVLLNIHNMLATVTTTPELVMDKEEANGMAKAVANVARHYDLKASEKALDWSNLIMTGVAVYGSRAVVIRMRMAEERKNKTPTRPVETGPIMPNTAPNGASGGTLVSVPGVGQVRLN